MITKEKKKKKINYHCLENYEILRTTTSLRLLRQRPRIPPTWSWLRCPGPWTGWKPSEYRGCPYNPPLHLALALSFVCHSSSLSLFTRSLARKLNPPRSPSLTSIPPLPTALFILYLALSFSPSKRSSLSVDDYPLSRCAALCV